MYKWLVEVESMKVAVSREGALCLSQWIVGVNEIANRLWGNLATDRCWGVLPNFSYCLFMRTIIVCFPYIVVGVVKGILPMTTCSTVASLMSTMFDSVIWTAPILRIIQQWLEILPD